MFTKKPITLQETLTKSRSLKDVLIQMRDGLSNSNSELDSHKEIRLNTISEAKADLQLIETEQEYNKSVILNVNKILGE